jgi:hypothetical protein
VDTPPDIVYPPVRNPFDAMLALGHEAEEPNRMPLARSAMACGFAAPAMSSTQRARQQVLGELELANQAELALAQPSGLGAFWFALHLNTIMYTELEKLKGFFQTRK